MGHKRNNSGDDAAAAARKASFAEQKPGSAGILGGMWQKYVFPFAILILPMWLEGRLEYEPRALLTLGVKNSFTKGK